MGQQHSTAHSENPIAETFVTGLTRGEIELSPPGYSEVLSLPPPPEYFDCLADLPRQNPPIDLACRVAEYLDPVSKLCFRYTSFKLFEGLEDFEVDGELGRCSAGSSQLVCQARDSNVRTKESRRAPQYDLSRDDRLRLLRYFLKDGFFADETSICGACVNVHRDALFLPVELQKQDSERSCKGWTGRVWVCPHRLLSYKDIFLEHSPETHGECFDCTSIHITTLFRSSARICFPIKRRIDSTTILTQEEVATAVALLGPVSACCPQFALSSLWDTKGPECTFCSAHYDVDRRPSDKGDESHLLRLVVNRNFTKITGVTDPKWLVQLVQMEEAVDDSRMKRLYAGDPFARWEWKLDATEMAWKEAATHCKRVMHVGDMKDHDECNICKDCIGKSCLRA